jgi:low temperature requirement protein LtrA
VSEPVEHRTTAVELLWDLVFVFAVTRVSTLLASHLSWAGFGRSMLVLALVWWAWSAFVWAANAQATESRELRLYLLLATALTFVTGLALTQAFSGGAMLFAITYAAVRFLHLMLYADASRKGQAAWSAIVGFAITVTIGMALLIVGAALGGGAQIALWAAAVAIDYAGPAWLTRERLRGLQSVVVEHFAERYSLFVIICLGESIVAIGVGAGIHPRLDAALVTKVSLGLLATIAMWWTYFDRAADLAQEHLRSHDDPVLAAADGYSYLHLAIVAGIIIFAVGAKRLVAEPIGAPLSDPSRLALCGGAALYLAGHLAFRLRLGGALDRAKVSVAAALMLVYLLTGGLPGWATAAIVLTLIAGRCAVEATLEQEQVEAPAVKGSRARR